MFDPEYPNLELLEYKARQMLYESEYFKNKMEEARKKTAYVNIYLDAYVFPQTWGSTCLGFDITASGEPAIGGQAMTKAYTAVFHEAGISDTYIVFFGGRAAYMVTEPSDKFLEDLRNQNLARLSVAKKCY
jgi:hypothetical protein